MSSGTPAGAALAAGAAWNAPGALAEPAWHAAATAATKNKIATAAGHRPAGRRRMDSIVLLLS
jgi:hypothetical protein